MPYAGPVMASSDDSDGNAQGSCQDPLPDQAAQKHLDRVSGRWKQKQEARDIA
jgi:hypothetical protein